MMETRVFAVLKAEESGLVLCLSNAEPDFPAEGVIAVLRVPGAISGLTEISLPGASVLTEG